MFDLRITKGGQLIGVYSVRESGITIGRHPDVEVVLDDPAVSRQHVRITCEAGALMIADLGSRNGVMVNGRRVVQAHLGEGDRFEMAEYTVQVLGTVTDETGGHAVITFGDGARLYQNMVTGAAGHLPVLYKAAQLLGTVFDLDDLLQQLLQLIFDAQPARRGFILILRSGQDEPEVRASLSRDETVALPPLSKTLVNRALIQGDAVLTLDAQADSRFDESVSVIVHAIRSAMCVPLCGRQAPVGAIYIDSGSALSANYSNEDLQLLMAIGRVVGVAVENAQLYQQNLDQARLAAIGLAMANIGHCVKNILSGMLGGIHFVENGRQSKDWGAIENGWPMLRRAIHRIELLVLNLLTFSTDRVPDRKAIDLNSIIDEVLETVRSSAERKRVALLFEATEMPNARVDGRGIYRILLNLVLNAIDACSQGGTVTIQCGQDNHGYVLAIKDTGTGISPEQLSKLFEAFQSTKGSGGTGLGLACSRKIAREHGGDIVCETVVGKGTVFRVFLPDCAETATN